MTSSLWRRIFVYAERFVCYRWPRGFTSVSTVQRVYQLFQACDVFEWSIQQSYLKGKRLCDLNQPVNRQDHLTYDTQLESRLSLRSNSTQFRSTALIAETLLSHKNWKNSRIYQLQKWQAHYPGNCLLPLSQLQTTVSSQVSLTAWHDGKTEIFAFS